MRNWLTRFFSGRNGPDTLFKATFFLGIIMIPLSFLMIKINTIWSAYLYILFELISYVAIIYSVIRFMSRNLTLRRLQNQKFEGYFLNKKRMFRLRREHFKDRKEWKYFKCPSCNTWLRVPKRKGKIHINCQCGYILYRKT